MIRSFLLTLIMAASLASVAEARASVAPMRLAAPGLMTDGTRFVFQVIPIMGTIGPEPTFLDVVMVPDSQTHPERVIPEVPTPCGRGHLTVIGSVFINSGGIPLPTGCNGTYHDNLVVLRPGESMFRNNGRALDNNDIYRNVVLGGSLYSSYGGEFNNNAVTDNHVLLHP